MNKKETGQMCIFLGYAAGVGKTYAMLEAAHDLKKKRCGCGCRIY